MTDSDLLIRYAESGAHEAFDAIVRRHTSKVYGTCLRILGEPHTAEDATQATFLVLSRKAPTMRRDLVLADWLFWTAKHCALNLKRGMKRRARHEREAAMKHEETANADSGWNDVRPHIDLALAALPARQREATVLHYFYGMTQTEIARRTGCPQTTVSRRLSSALEKLRGKLSAMGLSLSAAALAGFLAEKTAVEAPAGLAASISAACLGGATASAAAVSVADGVVKAVKIAQIKALTAVLGAAVLLGGGVTAISRAFAPPSASALADDPAIIARLRALQPGHGLRLPAAKVTGLEGLPLSPRLKKLLATGPGYRNKCNRMVYAPERNSAIYCGGSAADLFVTNDAWEFHLGANTWRLVSPPDGGDHREVGLAEARIKLGRDVEKNRDFLRGWYTNEVEYTDGYLRTRRNGGPVKPMNTWDGVSYDPAGRRLYWVQTGSYRPPVKAYFKHTGLRRTAPERKGTTIWSLSPESGRWQPEFGREPHPRTAGMGGTLVHDSTRGRLVWYVAAQNVLPHEYQMWAYDLRRRTWKDLAPNGGADLEALVAARKAPDEDLQAAYDPRGDRIVAVRGTRTWTYDCAGNRWNPAAAHAANNAAEQRTVFARASGSGAFLLADPKRGKLSAYDAGADHWEEITVRGDAPPGNICAGYFDRRLDVLVLYDGKDRAWVYRHTK